MITFEKFNLNDKPKFIEFKTFQKELETNVSLMTKNISIKTIEEIVNLTKIQSYVMKKIKLIALILKKTN